MPLKKPNLYSVRSRVWERAAKAYSPVEYFPIGPKRRSRPKVRIVNDPIRPFVYDTYITGKITSAGAGENNKEPEAIRNERKRTGRDSLARTVQVKNTRFNFALPNPVADRHHSDSRR